MRIRVNPNGSTTATYIKSRWDPDDAAASDVLGPPYQSSGFGGWMGDIVTPGYKKLSNKGLIVNSPMMKVSGSGTARHWQVSSRWYDRTSHMGGVELDGGVIQFPSFPPYNLPDEDSVNAFCSAYSSEADVAISRAWANVDVSSTQLLASLGELPETISWIRTIFQRALALLRMARGKLSKKDLMLFFGSSLSGLSTISGAWLEYRYAFRPLVFELRNALKALNAKLSTKPRATARGYNSTSSSQTAHQTVPLGTYGTVNIEGSIQRISDYRAGVLFTIDSNINSFVSIWGLDQPFETFWELTPFSFIIDWFFNVGDVISSWTPNSSLQPLTSWVVETHSLTGINSAESFTQLSFLVANRWDFSVTGFEPGYNNWTLQVKRRTVCPSRPILPSFNLRLDVGKLTDLALIGRQLIAAMKA